MYRCRHLWVFPFWIYMSFLNVHNKVFFSQFEEYLIICSNMFFCSFLSVFLRYSHCAYPGVLNDVPHFSEVPFIFLHSFSSVLFRLCISTDWSSSFFAGCSNLLWSFCNILLKVLDIVFPISLWFFLEFFLFLLTYCY